MIFQNTDEALAALGNTFRRLVLHSDGSWTANCRKKGIVYGRLFKGNTSLEVLQKMYDKIKQ